MPAPAMPDVLPEIEHEPRSESGEQLDSGYMVICWNDPVNLMSYVTHVFRVIFGWNEEKAQKHMLQVHHQGKSVLVRESLEKAEFYVHRLQSYKLHATMERE